MPVLEDSFCSTINTIKYRFPTKSTNIKFQYLLGDHFVFDSTENSEKEEIHFAYAFILLSSNTQTTPLSISKLYAEINCH